MKIGNPQKYDRFYVALGVPYLESGEIDYVEYRRACENIAQKKYTDQRFSYIVNPEAGELFALSLEESIRLMEIGREVMPADVPVFGGVVGSSLKQAIDLAKAAKEVGMDGIFICPPLGSTDITISWDQVSYPEVWIDWVLGIDAAVDMPIIIHPSAPANTEWGGGLSLPLVKETLQKCENVVGWKAIAKEDLFPDYFKMIRDFEAETGRHVGILCAGAYSFVDFANLGCLDGSVSCYLNFSMERISEILDKLTDGDLSGARAILDKGLEKLFKYANSGDAGFMRLHTNFKVATWLRGIYSFPFCRPPMPKPRINEVLTLARLLRETGYETIDQAKIDAVVNRLPR